MTVKNDEERDSYQRDSGVLHNNFNTDNEEFLLAQERDLSQSRIDEIELGIDVPERTFDRKHLQALHHKIFQDTYPWAGRARDEVFVINGIEYEQAGRSSKEYTKFLPSSLIDRGIHEAFKPLKQNNDLSKITDFSETAGEILGELNHAHIFREGNGRVQRALIQELGRENGHEVDFTVITATRNVEASINVHFDPDRDDLKEVILDATDPTRRDALRSAINAIEEHGHDPQEFNIRNSRVGETLEGSILKHNKETFTLVSEENTEIVVIDKLDLPKDYDKELASDNIKVDVANDISNLKTDERLIEVAKQDALKQLQNSQNTIRGNDDLEQ